MASRLTREEIDQKLAGAAAALKRGLESGDLASFYRAFRATGLPFLVEAHLDDPAGLYRSCFDVLHRLGGISPAVALALENHYYVSAALGTFPTRQGDSLDVRRLALIRTILEERMLVANTNSRVHDGKVGSIGSRARRVEGGLEVGGTAAYMSLAGEGDIVFFFTQIEKEGPALLVAPLRDNPEIEIGPLLFPRAMADSDTRRVTFRDAFIPDEGVLLAGVSEEISRMSAFQIAWHQTLIPAVFLGAAARALEEAKLFVSSVKAPNGRPLAELDGVQVEIGQLAIRYRGACALVHQAGQALEAMALGAAAAPGFDDLFELACAAKQGGTLCAEEIVTAVRRIIGARAFAGAHPLERLSQEVMFGPLAGEVNASIERRYGRRVLTGESLPQSRW